MLQDKLLNRTSKFSLFSCEFLQDSLMPFFLFLHVPHVSSL